MQWSRLQVVRHSIFNDKRSVKTHQRNHLWHFRLVYTYRYLNLTNITVTPKVENYSILKNV